MLVSGFEALQGMDHLRPSDYINYLEVVSAKSSRIQFPQLHVVISCKAASHNKNELTNIAKDWMKGMGYGDQPYIVVFHSDTDNAHVHIVSTRIDRFGKKIKDSFEHRKAYQVLNRIMGDDAKEQFSKAMAEALAYRFSTRPQFAMLMETKGFQLILNDGKYELFKFGELQGIISLAKVDERISMYERDKKRIIQLRAILEKYRLQHSGAVLPISTPLPGGRSGPVYGYSSKLAEFLHLKFGLQILYHGAPGKPPYGFSVIDHAENMVLKGKELMDIRDLTTSMVDVGIENQTEKTVLENRQLDVEIPEPSFSDISSDEQGLNNPRSNVAIYTSDSVVDAEKGEPFLSALEGVSLDIADDVDDEQILGPTRRRKRKARTNTR